MIITLLETTLLSLERLVLTLHKWTQEPCNADLVNFVGRFPMTQYLHTPYPLLSEQMEDLYMKKSPRFVRTVLGYKGQASWSHQKVGLEH